MTRDEKLQAKAYNDFYVVLFALAVGIIGGGLLYLAMSTLAG